MRRGPAELLQRELRGDSRLHFPKLLVGSISLGGAPLGSVVQRARVEAPQVPDRPGSRAPPSGRRAALLWPRLVTGAADVTALQASDQCSSVTKGAGRSEMAAEHDPRGPPVFRIEPSPSTQFRPQAPPSTPPKRRREKATSVSGLVCFHFSFMWGTI